MQSTHDPIDLELFSHGMDVLVSDVGGSRHAFFQLQFQLLHGRSSSEVLLMVRSDLKHFALLLSRVPLYLNRLFLRSLRALSDRRNRVNHVSLRSETHIV